MYIYCIGQDHKYIIEETKMFCSCVIYFYHVSNWLWVLLSPQLNVKNFSLLLHQEILIRSDSAMCPLFFIHNVSPTHSSCFLNLWQKDTFFIFTQSLVKWLQSGHIKIWERWPLGRLWSVYLMGVAASGRDEVTVTSVSVTFPTLASSRSCFSAKESWIMIIANWFPRFATRNSETHGKSWEQFFEKLTLQHNKNGRRKT